MYVCIYVSIHFILLIQVLNHNIYINYFTTKGCQVNIPGLLDNVWICYHSLTISISFLLINWFYYSLYAYIDENVYCILSFPSILTCIPLCVCCSKGGYYRSRHGDMGILYSCWQIRLAGDITDCQVKLWLSGIYALVYVCLTSD